MLTTYQTFDKTANAGSADANVLYSMMKEMMSIASRIQSYLQQMPIVRIDRIVLICQLLRLFGLHTALIIDMYDNIILHFSDAARALMSIFAIE